MIHSDESQEDEEDEDEDEDEDKDSSDDDDDDDEDEKRAAKPPSPSEPLIYTALSDFTGEQEGDLSVQVKHFLFHHQACVWVTNMSHDVSRDVCPCCPQRGGVLRIIRKTADGWWLAQDANGNQGVVPKTYLKVR